MSPTTTTTTSFSCTSNNSTAGWVSSTQPSLSILRTGCNIAQLENVHFKALVASLVIGCFCIAVLASMAIFCFIRRRLNARTKHSPNPEPDSNRTASSITAGAYLLGAIQKCQDWIDRHLQRRCQSAQPIYFCKTSSDLRTTDQLISSRDWLAQPLVPPQAPPATLSTTTAGYTSPPIITSHSRILPPSVAAFCYSPSIYSRRSSRSSSYTLFQEDYPPASTGLVSPI